VNVTSNARSGGRALVIMGVLLTQRYDENIPQAKETCFLKLVGTMTKYD
jgi:hypothetical protein